MTNTLTNTNNLRKSPATPSQRLLMLAGLLVAFALRLFHLGAESLWYDETVSVLLARKTMPELIAHTARDIHPPGYYLLLHGWQWLTKPTLLHGLEFLYAWPSLCFGLLIVALLYPLARRLYQAPTAILALWLAAVNPFHIWYSQEVRMYTLGGVLGLLCLWGLVRYIATNDERRTTNGVGRSSFVVRRWLLLYVISGALGLYTLYYFLFLLAALNLVALIVFWRMRQAQLRSPLLYWLGAQLLVGLLYSPWLPVLWRQALDPPVPTWRTPWPTLSALMQSISESLSALLIGQRPPDATLWPWAIIAGGVVIFFFYTKTKRKRTLDHAQRASQTKPPAEILDHALSVGLALYVFMPILLIYLVTLTITPLYHVRYLFTYAPPFMVLVAHVLWQLRRLNNNGRFQRWLSAAAVAGMFLVSSWGLKEFWFNPLYRTDDHRAAVAQLAAQWRPGDLILVNAGWVYPVLATYWPTELRGPDSALPPPIAEMDRLTTYANEPLHKNNPVIIVRTGSVDGAPSLGWGQPDSDFYAMSAAESLDALSKIGDAHTRIWHYRLYDTVSDPQGVLRAWLDAHAALLSDTPFPGRDYLRLQLYKPYTIKPTDLVANPIIHEFSAALRLQEPIVQPEFAAGTTLYIQTHWLALPGIQKLPAAASLSLRLYDGNRHLLAQKDEAPRQSTNSWQPGQPYDVPLALPVPVATKPGDYELILVVYDQQSGTPLATPGAQAESGGVTLGRVRVQVAQTAPEISEPLASFDYIDLIAPQLTGQPINQATPLDLRLVWRPRPNTYRDTYLGVLALHNAQGAIVQSWSAALGGWDYPSGAWPTNIPVQEWRQIRVAPNTPAGIYQLTLRVTRSSDNQTIPARQGLSLSSQTEVVIGNVAVAVSK